jgi:hypothetical protein
VFDKQPWNDIHHTTSSVTFADYSKAHTITNVCRKIRAETQALGNKSRTFGFVDKDNFLSCISRFTVNQRNAITHVKLQYELEATIIVPPPGGALETMTFVDSSPDLDILPHLPHLRHVPVELNVDVYGLAESKITVDALKGHMWFRTFKHILDGVRCLEEDLQVTAVYSFKDTGCRDWLEDDEG